MKKTKTLDPKDYDDGMLPEYDFTGKKPIRGKYYLGRRQGYTVRIHNEDGTMTEKYYSPMIALEPDVAAYFPDAESVNNALRTLIALVPERKIGEKKAKYKVTKQKAKRAAVKK